LVGSCLEMERQRGLAARSLQELGRLLGDFAGYCREAAVQRPAEMDADFLRKYVQWRCREAGPPLVKAAVWSLRRFGAYLAVQQILEENPARALRHPGIPARAKLPEYLSPAQLRGFLETAARNRSAGEFALLALLAGTGMRPHEIASLERSDLFLGQHRILLRVKGGWKKNTPLSGWLAGILDAYLGTRRDSLAPVFIGRRQRPTTVSWIQRLVRQAGREAGLPLALTCNHLRHTFATHAADRHGRILTRALLGHQHLATTSVYTHLSPRHFRGLMNRHPYQMRIGRGEHHA
ncbi:MAG TPA: tyrosine-type recombinase/integrase, partial [Candidatus Methanoperedens sp.]|nr:tyrosine-type recombinase/integrase [Candidatus Methanoperedens sp.]